MRFLDDIQLGGAFLISSILHFVVIVGIPGLGMLTFNKPLPQTDEMTYIILRQAAIASPKGAAIASPKGAAAAAPAPPTAAPAASFQAAATEAAPIRLRQESPAKAAAAEKKEAQPQPKKAAQAEPKIEAPRKIERPHLASAFTEKPILNKVSEREIAALRNSPQYRDYCQLIREAIRSHATAYYNRFTEIGEVTVSFAVQSDGTLREVKIIEGASTSNEYLRKVAAQSVISASPYPVFPKGFPITELIFKLPISFRGGRIDLT